MWFCSIKHYDTPNELHTFSLSICDHPYKITILIHQYININKFYFESVPDFPKIQQIISLNQKNIKTIEQAKLLGRILLYAHKEELEDLTDTINDILYPKLNMEI